MRKPRVCFVSESKATYGLLTGEGRNVVGGAELQQTLLAAELQKLGYPVTFLVSDFGQPPKVVTPQGFTLIKTRPDRSASSSSLHLADILRLFRALNRAGADIYYQRASATVTGIVALFCKLKRKPFVFSVASNLDLDDSSRHLLRLHCPVLYQYGLTRATEVVVQTEDQLRMLRENVGRNGVLIRSTFSSPDETEPEARREYALWVGNFRRARRPEMYVELASRLPQYKFVMVGGAWTGEEALFDEIRAKARNVSNLKLTGAVPYEEAGKYFSGAIVFVNTSSVEGFPNTYLQAWCRGVPVVGTFDADGLISKYGLGRHCLSLDELVGAVEELMMNKALRASMGEQARRYVKEHHGPEVIAAKYDELFVRLHRDRRKEK